jgi:hypothetical protein
MNYSDAVLQEVYDKHSIHNRAEIEASSSCGCFACFGTFAASAVWDWIPSNGDTGCCPYCTMDTVLGDSTGLPVTDDEFLRAVNAKALGGQPVYWDQTIDPHPITGPGDWKQVDKDMWVLEPGYGKSQKSA